MDLEKIKHLTINDIMEFAPTMELSIKDAKDVVEKYQKKHGIDFSGVQDVCRVVRAIGLYK